MEGPMEENGGVCPKCFAEWKPKKSSRGFDRRRIQGNFRGTNETIVEALRRLTDYKGPDDGYICSPCVYQLTKLQSSSASTPLKRKSMTLVGTPETKQYILDVSLSPIKRRERHCKTKVNEKHLANSRRKGIARRIARNVTNANYATAIRQILSCGFKAKRAFQTVMANIMTREVKGMKKVTDKKLPLLDDVQSIVQSITDFDWQTVISDLSIEMPTLCAGLKAAMVVKSVKDHALQEEKYRTIIMPRIGLMLSVILYTLNRQSYKFLQAVAGVQLWRCGSSDKLQKCFNQLGICQSSSVTRKNVERLSQGIESASLQCKQESQPEDDRDAVYHAVLTESREDPALVSSSAQASSGTINEDQSSHPFADRSQTLMTDIKREVIEEDEATEGDESWVPLEFGDVIKREEPEEDEVTERAESSMPLELTVWSEPSASRRRTLDSDTSASSASDEDSFEKNRLPFGGVPNGGNQKDLEVSKKSKNTNLQTERCVTKYKGWLVEQGEDRSFLEITPREMDTYFGRFLLSIRRPDGSEYQPDSLTTMTRAINRHFGEIKYPESILTSKSFEMSRNFLEAKRKDLKQKGLGNKPNRAEALTDAEEEKLWSAGQLGVGSPEALLNTIWYYNTKLFGFRGNDESRQLRWGDFKLESDELGEYVLWNERSIKTRQGRWSAASLNPFRSTKMYATPQNTERCPVAVFKAYRSHRPCEMLDPNADFYLSVNYTRKSEDFIWYKRSPLGINMLKSMMRKMCGKAGVYGKKTNHSVQKTMRTQLLNARVHPNTIVQFYKNGQTPTYGTASRDKEHDHM